MALKLFKLGWFVSVVFVAANLLYVYAGLPFEVVVQDQGERVVVSREVVFYGALFGIVLINALVYVVKRLSPQNHDLRAWFHGFIITINVFFVVAFWSLSVYNSVERFDHSIVAAYILGSLGLIVIWAAAWPLYQLYQKFFYKPTV